MDRLGEQLKDIVTDAGGSIDLVEAAERLLEMQGLDPRTAERLIRPLLEEAFGLAVEDERIVYSIPRRAGQNLPDMRFAVVSTRRPERGPPSRPTEISVVVVEALRTTQSREFRNGRPSPRGGRGEEAAGAARLARLLGTGVLASFHLSRDLGRINGVLSMAGLDRLGNETLSLRRLALLLVPDAGGRDLRGTASHFGLPTYEGTGSLSDARTAADVLIELLRIADGLGIRTLPDLRRALEATRTVIEWDRYAFDRSLIRNLPPRPGVYMMKDRKGDTIYVGKALSLRERVASYFTGREEGRIEGLRERVFDIEYELTGTALLALLREAEIIAACKPAFNTQLTAEKRPTAGKSAHPPAGSGGKLLLLPSVALDRIDLLLLSEGRPLWRGGLRADLANLPEQVRAIRAVTGRDPAGSLDPDREREHSIVTSWLSRNEDVVNVVEIEGDETAEELETKIRRFVESGDWSGEKVVHRF